MTTKNGRVVLNLSIDQAITIKRLLASEQDEIARKVCQRIEHTLNKPIKETVIPQEVQEATEQSNEDHNALI